MEPPSPLVEIRPAVMSDWRQLRTLAGALFPELSETDISYLLRHYHSGTVVACHGRDLVGYYQVNPRNEPGVIWLNYLGVLPAWRGKGAAADLLSMCERHGKTCGFDFLELDVLKDNVRALRFYERNGYVELVKKAPPGGDKLRLTKPLAQTPALPQPMPSLAEASVFTAAVRKIAYSTLLRWPAA